MVFYIIIVCWGCSVLIRNTVEGHQPSFAERLSSSWRLRMNYCCGKGVQKCILCWEAVPFLEGPLSEIERSTVDLRLFEKYWVCWCGYSNYGHYKRRIFWDQSFAERLSSSWRFEMNHCYGKGVQNSVLCCMYGFMVWADVGILIMSIKSG